MYVQFVGYKFVLRLSVAEKMYSIVSPRSN